MFAVAFKGVPLLAGLEVKELQVVGHLIGIEALPRAAVDDRRDKGTDVAAGLQKKLSGFNAHLDAVSPQGLA